MTARELVVDFNVGTVRNGKYERQDIVATWTSEVPQEVVLHIWTPATGDQEEQTVKWSLSRDMLARVTAAEDVRQRPIGEPPFALMRRVAFKGHPTAEGAVKDWVYVHVARPEASISLTFDTTPLAAFVRTSLAMVPREDEAVDVDGAIQQIFQNAEENDR